ncbi:hypothetical protein VTK56DRAFT_1723 [Thermocarpiscus australiensis]
MTSIGHEAGFGNCQTSCSIGRLANLKVSIIPETKPLPRVYHGGFGPGGTVTESRTVPRRRFGDVLVPPSAIPACSLANSRQRSSTSVLVTSVR